MDGEDALLPESISGNKRSMLQGTVILLLIFFTVAIILTIIYGLSYQWYLILISGILCIFITTLTLAKWSKQGDMIEPDQQLKWIIIINTIGLLLIFISLIAIENTPFDKSKCPKCPTCTGCAVSSTQSPCGNTAPEPQIKPSLCYQCPDCMTKEDMNNTICVYVNKKNDYQMDNPHLLL